MNLIFYLIIIPIGYLTLDEFTTQLKQFDFKFTEMINKLSNSEISALIAEADTDDGVIQYYEYVPFAVGMILSFRARNIGNNKCCLKF